MNVFPLLVILTSPYFPCLQIKSATASMLRSRLFPATECPMRFKFSVSSILFILLVFLYKKRRIVLSLLLIFFMYLIVRRSSNLSETQKHLRKWLLEFRHYEAKKACKIQAFFVKHLFCSLIMVGVTGFEPTTSWSRTKRATNCATPRYLFFVNSSFLLAYSSAMVAPKALPLSA